MSDLLEPGSVFKTASIMVALDDEVCDTNYVVATGGGVYNMYGRDMKDHNWRRGGYGTMNLPHTLEVSSNIGVSRIIDHFYHNNPERFVQGIHDLGLAEDFHLPIPGYSPAKIRMPRKDSRGKQYVNWSKTALPWMSIGYETQVPPISTLTFYNAIANGGKMMRPRFVKQVVKDGEVIMDFPPEVVKEQIAKPRTIELITTILTHVVSQGLGRKAGSPSFAVAGKTGTAQMSKGAAGYHSGVMNYLLSFCGFFPADKPRYSCMPGVKAGNLVAADYVLSKLGFEVKNGWEGGNVFGPPVWGTVQAAGGNKLSMTKSATPQKHRVPNVMGMGARDAVYLMEQQGIKVRLRGRGKVAEQSLHAGDTIGKNTVCMLRLN